MKRKTVSVYIISKPAWSSQGGKNKAERYVGVKQDTKKLIADRNNFWKLWKTEGGTERK